MIRTCFSTIGCPDWTFLDMIHRGVEAGFDGVEIRLVERETDLLNVPGFSSSQLAQRRRELDESGFTICSLASSVAFDSPDSTDRQRQLETGRAYLDLATALDAQSVRVFGDIIRDEVGRDALVEQVAEGLNRLGEYAETLGREVIIETHGDYSRSDLVADTLNLVESPAVGVLWDTHHPWRFHGESLASTYRVFGDRVRHTHWKDSVYGRDGDNAADSHEAAARAHALMGGHQHADYVLFGGGEFPILECLSLLHEGGYDGWYSYEWEKMWHPELEPPELALPLFPPKIRQFQALASTS